MKNRKKFIVSSILVLAVLFSATALTVKQTNLLSLNEANSDNATQTEQLSYLEKTDNSYAELKCGEGKCGDGDSETDKGESKSKSDESKCSEGKCGDGKDAEESGETKEEKSDDAKCGEGKCGDGN